MVDARTISNPWTSLEEDHYRVLAMDRPYVEQFNKLVDKQDKRFVQTQLMPEPFFGSPDAKVVLLLANPAYKQELDDRVHECPEFRAGLRVSINHNPTTPFFFLLPERANTPGGVWWRNAIAGLAEDVSIDDITANLSAIELFPYHSVKFGHAHIRLPSQPYSIWLVEQAIRRNAVIVCMRSWINWLGAVPALGRYRTFQNKYPIKSEISRSNLGDKAYESIAQALIP